jgi:glycosyltransferase involved in cell wall biosynthesis
MSGLSVVVPVRNEAENIPKLVARLTPVLQAISTEYEIIFATDLNRDNTLEVLRSLQRSDPRVKTLKLSNAFGHHVAVLAGLAVSRGMPWRSWTVTCRTIPRTSRFSTPSSGRA